MINRTLIANGNTTFNNFAACSGNMNIGEIIDLPMNCWGSVVNVFEIVSKIIEADGVYIHYEAKNITQ